MGDLGRPGGVHLGARRAPLQRRPRAPSRWRESSGALAVSLPRVHRPIMPGPEELSRPLSDDEWSALEAFLDSAGGPNLDTVVGFLTATVTAGRSIPPSEWLPVVLGDRDPGSPDDDPMFGLLLRMYNTISSTLEDGRVLCPPPEEAEDIESFCIGYLMGVDLDHGWIDNFDAMKPVFPIAVLAGDHPLNDPDGEDDRIEDEEGWMAEARETLSSVLLEAYEELATVRKASAPGGFVREGPKVGRNDPCPCGSGKKYKKCCLRKQADRTTCAPPPSARRSAPGGQGGGTRNNSPRGR